ncbi:MAG: hypothetical protein M1812_001510 [Candelaria pacifica]|nr:MAG: hypothetical protein M1812_001510 [Candelaria pacifica]
MGQGGVVVLVNGTSYVWDLVGQNAYQMEWEFERDAREVKPGQALSVYVEAKATIFKTKSDDSGNATYLLRGAPQPQHFEIQARYLNLQVFFKDFGTQNNPPGAVVPLGMISDRPSYFVLSGHDGAYHSVNTAPDWMQANSGALGPRTLRQLCLPYSHDAGMSIMTNKTSFATSNTVVTQMRSVGQQLQLGVRMFDIRPHIFRGQYVCGHYSDLESLGGWIGGNGEAISTIMQQVNQFTASNKELVILELNLAYDTHDYQQSFTSFGETEWHRLLDYMTGPEGIKDLYVSSQAAAESVDLTNIPLIEFIGARKAAVVLLVDADINLQNYSRRGCFKKSQLPRSELKVDQMQQKQTADRDRAFFYWGTRMQEDREAVLATFGHSSSSVIALAKEPKDAVFRQLFPACTKECFPNFIAVDAIDSTDFTAMALAINDLD